MFHVKNLRFVVLKSKRRGSKVNLILPSLLVYDQEINPKPIDTTNSMRKGKLKDAIGIPMVCEGIRECSPTSNIDTVKVLASFECNDKGIWELHSCRL